MLHRIYNNCSKPVGSPGERGGERHQKAEQVERGGLVREGHQAPRDEHHYHGHAPLLPAPGALTALQWRQDNIAKRERHRGVYTNAVLEYRCYS